ncbi:hypothetical protein Q5O24_12960 [Eubacteriaceae bacterium ES3]|nr:hypothetical protein Q5O24_12960 [Eubacteriaceae bacterium ES3]
MVKIGFPREFDKISFLFPEKEKQKDLYIAAEDTETDEVLGAIRFYYDDAQVSIYEIKMPCQSENRLSVLDGIVRTLFYKMAEMEFKKALVKPSGNVFDEYFLGHKFIKGLDGLVNEDFPAEFFKPCEGCRGQ